MDRFLGEQGADRLAEHRLAASMPMNSAILAETRDTSQSAVQRDEEAERLDQAQDVDRLAIAIGEVDRAGQSV